jgi:hypothetical protein
MVDFSRIYGQVCSVVTQEDCTRYTMQEKSPYFSYLWRKAIVIPVVALCVAGGSLFSYYTYSFDGHIRSIEKTFSEEEGETIAYDDTLIATDYGLTTLSFEE